MIKIKYIPFVFLLVLLFPSCTKTYFNTQNQTSTKDDKNYISKYEVTIGEWITYVVTSSFNNNEQPIFLGDHLDVITSKLPLSEMRFWNDFVIQSLLKKSAVMSQPKVYDHCIKKYYKITVPTTAWDSIVKNKLFELPIVGISYEQVLDYLAYKKNILNECKQKGEKTNEKYVFDCFLASPSDFNGVIKSCGFPCRATCDSINRLGCNLYNYKNCLCSDCPIAQKFANHPVYKDIGRAPLPVWVYFPCNEHYNLIGNVAEMTSIKGVAIGGSFHHYAIEIGENKVQTYTKPEPWLGFRVWFKTYPKYVGSK